MIDEKLKISKNDYDKLRKKEEYILTGTYELKPDEFSKIIHFHDSFKTEKTGISALSTIETYFIEESTSEKKRQKLTEQIYNWCYENDIPIYNTLGVLTELFISIQTVLKKIFRESYGDIVDGMFSHKDNKEFVHEKVLESFMKSFSLFMTAPSPTLKLDPKMYERLIENTYIEIKQKVKASIAKMDLPLSQYSIQSKSVLEDIEDEKDMILNIIKNPKSFTKIKQENHFIHHLRDADIGVTENGYLFFDKHAKGLTIGYNNKAILLSLDKDSSIRELQTKLKHLQDYNMQDSEELIHYTESLINFIRQQKYANIIPFKALSKELGLTKNQAKNYAKRLFSINDNTFKKHFDTINIWAK